MSSVSKPTSRSGGRALRVDARRNREAILAAAEQAFAREGNSVPLDRIAALAKVGPGTLHRNFPTKDALLAAVLVERLEALTRLAREHDEGPEPGDAFFAFLRILVDRSHQNLALVDAFAEPASVGKAVREAAASLEHALGDLLARAQGAGIVRGDLGVDELHALLVGALAAERCLPSGSGGRAVAVIEDGLRV